MAASHAREPPISPGRTGAGPLAQLPSLHNSPDRRRCGKAGAAAPAPAGAANGLRGSRNDANGSSGPIDPAPPLQPAIQNAATVEQPKKRQRVEVAAVPCRYRPPPRHPTYAAHQPHPQDATYAAHQPHPQHATYAAHQPHPQHANYYAYRPVHPHPLHPGYAQYPYPAQPGWQPHPLHPGYAQYPYPAPQQWDSRIAVAEALLAKEETQRQIAEDRRIIAEAEEDAEKEKAKEGYVVSIYISDEGSIGITLEQMKGNLAMIKAVNPNSIAEKAGLMAGDLPLLLGQRAPYDGFIEAGKTRPFVFQVLRGSTVPQHMDSLIAEAEARQVAKKRAREEKKEEAKKKAREAREQPPDIPDDPSLLELLALAASLWNPLGGIAPNVQQTRHFAKVAVQCMEAGLARPAIAFYIWQNSDPSENEFYRRMPASMQVAFDGPYREDPRYKAICSALKHQSFDPFCRLVPALERVPLLQSERATIEASLHSRLGLNERGELPDPVHTSFNAEQGESIQIHCVPVLHLVDPQTLQIDKASEWVAVKEQDAYICQESFAISKEEAHIAIGEAAQSFGGWKESFQPLKSR